MMPQVFIVILNYNSLAKTLSCLKSLSQLNYPRFAVCVVDNASPDGSGVELSAVQEKFKFRLVLNPENTGYAAGNRIGVELAIKEGAELIWILSPDTLVEPDSLLEMVKVHQSLEKPGIVGSLVLYDNSRNIYFYRGLIQSNGKVKHLGERRAIDEIPELNLKQQGETDFVNGCSMLFSTALIAEVGFMVEDYFLYYEDPDWSLRVSARGFQNRVAYKSVIHHMKQDNPKRNYVAEFYCRRNEYFFRRRHGYPVSKAHYLGRLALRWVKHQIKALLGASVRENQNMAYVMALVMKSVRQEKLGYQALSLPYPGER